MRTIFIISLIILVTFLNSANAKDSTFSLHLSSEPSSLDPQKQKSSASSYLLGNLYRNLFYYDDKKGLVPDLAQECSKKDQVLTCKIKKNLKWSDGTSLTSSDFLKTYRKILNPKAAAPRADLLFKVKNALEIFRGKKNYDSLGITTPDAFTLRFELSELDLDFEYNLANFILAPTKDNLQITSGPYKIKEWLPGNKITLTKNSQYHAGHPNRPDVDFLFIEEDTVALQLYEKNLLKFLRRLPTLFIPSFVSRKDFHWLPVLRLDYIGFGPELKDDETLRKAFTYSLNYRELQKIFSSKGLPGCVGLPDEWFPQKAPCFTFDLKQIKKTDSKKTYTFMFSSLGGEDHKRATEWMQDQWSKNAGLKTLLVVKENKVFLSELTKSPPALFRKGVALDRPTCLAALETFSRNNPENFIQLNSNEYETLLIQLSSAREKLKQKKLCLEGVQFLLSRHLLIPTGPIQFAILAKPEFKGWKLNQMNQLDLSGLHLSP